MDQLPPEWRAVRDSGGSGEDAAKTSAGGGRLIVVVGAAMLVVVFVSAGWLALNAGSAREVSLDAPSPSGEAAPQARDELVVHVAGAVRRPGVYRVVAGSRVGDAVAAAGGFASSVDAAASEQQLNLAAPIEDGAKILVPERGGTPVAGNASGAAGPTARAAAQRVDVNRATQAELEELPGIGPVTAKKILDARAEAPFGTVEELRDRKVLGASTFEKIRDLVTVGG